MTADVDVAGTARVLGRNPFPGLRPFEPHDSPLFFGREDQCDDLLMRLGRQRLVAVVGMSGSGKSSLVRAGLLPALDRGYLPAAGSSWHIAIFRPGSDPVANLAGGLATRRLAGGGAAEENPDDIRAQLDASSLGLVAVARRLLHETRDSLLIVVDQFEELFRFGQIAKDNAAAERSAACVDLLLNVSKQEEVPVYVVLTMRSDYLGDCAHFTGLPEALSDSQFLVPRMTRAQLREAIESPVSVGGARITPRLVQRLLHDIDDIPAADEPRVARQEQDQLPVLQHALMRMWEVSRPARERGEPIDLPHYERLPVETLRHALDRHAEEVYQELPTDLHRRFARLLFQQLTDRDAENREVRRPTPLGELKAVGLQAASTTATPADDSVVDDVIAAFSAPGCAFVVVNAQQDVDVSHESFIRRWARLREWVEEESKSRRVYTKLADAAAAWERREASLYRGPELAEARRWWDRETPTQSWANRYDSRFEVARRFLLKSVRRQRLRRGLLFSNVALLLVSAVAIAALMTIIGRRARADEAAARADEAAALEARNNTDTSLRRLEEANSLIEQALVLQREGKSSQADALVKQAQQVQETKAESALTPSELSELDRLRRQEAAWQQTEADLRNQLATLPDAPPRPEVAAEIDQLRSSAAAYARENVELRQKLAIANDRVAVLQNPQSPTGPIDELQPSGAEKPSSTSSNIAGIEQLLRDYAAAYELRDAQAVVKLMPSAKTADLTKSFSQLNEYKIEILEAQISVNGDSAVVTCTRRISIAPRVGARPAPRLIPSVLRLKQSGGVWTIESVEERR